LEKKRVIENSKDLFNFKKGEILVIDARTEEDYYSYLSFFNPLSNDPCARVDYLEK
jgi:hypothetical protein